MTLAGLLALSSASSVAAGGIADAVQAALERDPRYPLHESTRAVGAGYRQQADSLLGGDPSLSVLAKSDQLIGSDRGYQEYEAAVSLPLWLPGQRGARRSIADSLDNQATTELQLIGWEVVGSVLEKAWDLRLAQGAEQQARQQWQSAERLQRDIARRVRAGELPRGDLLLAEQETLNRRAALDDAADEVEHVGLAWRSLTGLDALPMDLELQTEAATDPNPNHPLLLAALGETGTARARRNSTSKNRRAPPVLTLYAKRDRGVSDDPFTNSIGAEISIPFGSGAHSAPGIAEAEAELTRSQAALAEIERELVLTQKQAKHALKQAKRRLASAGRRDALGRSRLQLSQRAFELGEIDLYQLLLARQQAADAALDLERSELRIIRAIAINNHVLGHTL